MNYSQHWVEIYIGFTKGRLNARNKAAEALAENAKLLEGYKLFFGQHFVKKETSNAPASEGDSSSESDEESESCTRFSLFTPKKMESVHSAENRRFKIAELLRSYIMQSEDLSDDEAGDAVTDDLVWCYGGVRVCAGEEWHTTGSLLSGGKRAAESRANFYVAAEFYMAPSEGIGQDDEEEDTEIRHVYYGRVLKILQYTFRVRGV